MNSNPHEIQEQMEGIAGQAVLMASEQFQAHLDYSGDSLQMVEAIVREFAEDFPAGSERAAGDEENIEESIASLSTLLGAYVGEVLRRATGGHWELRDAPGESEPMLLLEAGGQLISPPMDIFERLSGGNTESLWDQYRRMFPQLDSPERPGGGLVQLN